MLYSTKFVEPRLSRIYRCLSASGAKLADKNIKSDIETGKKNIKTGKNAKNRGEGLIFLSVFVIAFTRNYPVIFIMRGFCCVLQIIY
jgi:hypothetical protein